MANLYSWARASLSVLAVVIYAAASLGCRHAPTRASSAAYVVKKGDTLSAIAQRHGVGLSELARANGIDNPNRLSVGMRLRIPSAAPARAEPSVDEAPVRRQGALRQVSATADPPPWAPRSDRSFIWPVDGVVISKFGMRDGDRHDGIDIAAPPGTPVWAAAEGRVAYVGMQPGYGRLVIVKHASGFVTVYANNAVNLVSEREAVKRGQPIARVGSSGASATPALHFEVRKGSKPTNPLSKLKAGR